MNSHEQTAAIAPAVPRAEDLVLTRLVTWHFIAALVYLGISMLGGIIVALQLIHWNFLPKSELFSPGRWRMVHTNAVAYGFLANAFIGMLHWVVPRLTWNKVASKALSYFIFFAWQAIVLSTAGAIILGPCFQDAEWIAKLAKATGMSITLGAQGIEWGETPIWIDPIALLGLLLLAINFMVPIGKSKGPMYVTVWYFMAAFVWTFLTYAMGNFVPEYFVPGTSGGAIAGLFIHDLVGLFVTPLGWGMMYYFVPIIMGKPIWSHGLSLVGFWGLAFFYPLNGIHHFLYTPIPMFLQYGAIISTVAVELVVTTVIINFIGSVWGRGREVFTNLPLRYFFTGIMFYFLTCLQCSFQTTLTFQELIHFSDWVVGHAHMVMFGVFTMWLFGVMTYLFPRILGKPWHSEKLTHWHYWFSTVGVAIMSADLIMLGVFQGYWWGSLKPWEASYEGSQPFWILRIFAGLSMFFAYLCFVYNLYMTYATKPAAAPSTVPMGTGRPATA
jgi:cytochrome c oxidase cbb3-type subunit 1